MHLLSPVAQAVHHQLHGPGVQHVQHVAGSGEIDVFAWIVRIQVVVRLVVDSAEADGRSETAALAGVIVDHIENDLDADAVQRPHHHLELADLLAQTTGRVAAIGREIADRVVTPVVDQPALGQAAFAQHMMNRQQLDRGDAEFLQVFYDRLRGEGQVSAPKLFRHVGMLDREAAGMALVNQGAVPGRPRRPIVTPGKGRVHDHALWKIACAVARIHRQIFLRVADDVAECRIAAADWPADRLRVRVEEKLRRVEAETVLGPKRAVHTITV